MSAFPLNKKDIRLTPAFVVEWRDATCDSGWCHEMPRNRDADGITSRIVSVGYLMRKTKTEISIAQSLSVNDHAAEILTIPRGWVQKMTRIRVPTNKRVPTKKRVPTATK